MTAAPPPEPPADCQRCPRLAEFRAANQVRHPDFLNAPVPSFGDTDAKLLVVGLAPGLKGANRTGRPFTGDWAGDLLYPTLVDVGFARGTFRADPNDGLELIDCRVTNAVKCVPPENKPTTEEIRTCRSAFLQGEIRAMGRLRAVLALGKIAHDTLLVARGLRQSHYRFAHSAWHELPDGLILADSYHCSRYNTNTGRLTPEMFHDVLGRLARELR
jgi:uracil-DNA glycosylase family 4